MSEDRRNARPLERKDGAHRRQGLREANHRAHDGLRAFVASRAGFGLLGVWSFLEASLFFLLPDFPLLLYCALCRRNTSRYLLTVFAASLMGVAAFLAFSAAFPDFSLRVVRRVPFVTESMFDTAQARHGAEGTRTLLTQSVSGIPVKVWIVTAPRGRFPSFLAFVAISRLMRMALVALLGNQCGRICSQALRNYFLPLIAAASMGLLLVLFILS